MAYLTKLFQPLVNKSLSSQIGQFFRGYPNLTIQGVSASRTGKGTSLQITATANGTRHFAAEFAGNSLQNAATQVEAFFAANPSVVPVQVIDISPPKQSSARERLLVIYSQALAVAGGALPQGPLSTGVVGDAQLLGAYGEPRGLVSLRNVGDAAWPAGGRGTAWRSALTGAWGGIGRHAYSGAVPAYTSTTIPATTTQDPHCCGGSPISYLSTPPGQVVNTSSTTAFPVSAPSSTPAWSTPATPSSGTLTAPGSTTAPWIGPPTTTAPTKPTYTVPFYPYTYPYYPPGKYLTWQIDMVVIWTEQSMSIQPDFTLGGAVSPRVTWHLTLLPGGFSCGTFGTFVSRDGALIKLDVWGALRAGLWSGQLVIPLNIVAYGPSTGGGAGPNPYLRVRDNTSGLDIATSQLSNVAYAYTSACGSAITHTRTLTVYDTGIVSLA